MKKYWVPLILAGFLLVCFAHRIDAYEAHSMPGGKNYLASDNFPIDVFGAESLDPIMVKPNMYYTLSVTTYYNQEEGNVRVSFLTDGAPHSQTFYAFEDFVVSSDPQFCSITFKTPPTVNYLSIRFYHGGDFFNDGDPGDFQLEEGTMFSGYQPYVGPSIYDTTGPAFIGNSVILVNVDQPLSVAEILESFTAYDAISGDVTSSIAVIANTYTQNQQTVGTYAMTIRAFDQAGNHTTVTFSVRVIDVTKPVLTGPSELIVAYPNVKTMQSILAEFSVSDNYDAPGTVPITVVSNEYVGNETVLGDYAIVFEAEDTSGNKTTKTLILRVQDRAEPLITGPSTVSVGYHLVLSEAELLAMFSVEDDHDGDLSESLRITVNPYSPNPSTIGSYLLWLEVADTTGNETMRALMIHVVDLIGPIVYYDTSVLTVYNNTILLLSDITKLLIASSVLSNRDYRAIVRFDSYSKYARIPGIYHMEIEYSAEGIEPTLQTLKIVVREAAGDFIPGNPVDPNDDSPSFWQKNWGWFGSGFFLFATISSNFLWWKTKHRK
jgi:hypothetical protein